MSRRDTAVLILMAVLGLLLASEFRFTIQEDKTNGMIRLDRLTGDLARVTTLLPSLPTPGPPDRSLHNWEKVTLKQHGNVNLTLGTKWRDGELQYHFAAEPLTKQLEDGRNEPFSAYTVLLQDTDGFPVAEIRVPLNEMTRVVDDKGSGKGLEKYGHLSMVVKSYDAVSSWNVSWNFGRK